MNPIQHPDINAPPFGREGTPSGTTLSLYHKPHKIQRAMSKKTSEYEQIWLDMQKAFSTPRISRFTDSSDADELDSLGRYYWNMALCEALYPTLHCLEIALRNAVHDALSTVKRRPDWYNTPGLLRSYEHDKVAKAKYDLTKSSKPHDPGRVIAELTFGFWTSLFVHHYDRSIAIPVIPIAFSGAPKKIRTRAKIHPILENVRYVRNRVFHHEPIYYWNDLRNTYRQMQDVIRWISPSACSLIFTVDRFDEVYRRGWRHYRDEIKYKLLLNEEAVAQTTLFFSS